jgi:hypothetical protein
MHERVHGIPDSEMFFRMRSSGIGLIDEGNGGVFGLTFLCYVCAISPHYRAVREEAQSSWTSGSRLQQGLSMA